MDNGLGESTVADLVDEVAERFEDVWLSGSPPDICSFLPQSERLRDEVLQELVKLDLEYRLKAGEQIIIESYLERFPELHDDEDDDFLIELLVEEHKFRRRRGDSVAIDDYVARFPEHEVRIREAMLAALAADTVDLSMPPLETTIIGPADAENRPEDVQRVPKQFGKYELLTEIARGGMGVVYKARQRDLDRIVALKMIRSGELADEEQVNRFLVEARAIANLSHPNIVAIHEVGTERGLHFFSMEYVAGQSLKELIADEPLPPREAAQLMQTIAKAMHYAHGENIIHRDLKPANILLDKSRTPKVADFGLAKRLDQDSDLTATEQIVGTPSYMAPEQTVGSQRVAGPADIYALGAILYELVTGRPPFRAASRIETIDQVRHEEPVAPLAIEPGHRSRSRDNLPEVSAERADQEIRDGRRSCGRLWPLSRSQADRCPSDFKTCPIAPLVSSQSNRGDVDCGIRDGDGDRNNDGLVLRGSIELERDTGGHRKGTSGDGERR